MIHKFLLGRTVFSTLALAALAQCAPTLAMAQNQFRGTTYQTVADGHPDDFLVKNGHEDTYFDSPTPKNISIVNQSKTYSGSGGDAVYSSSEAVNFRGFWSTVTFLSLKVKNAYYPTNPAYGTSPPFGYFALGGVEFWTKNPFISPQALNDATATFQWHVSGNADSNLGLTTSRLDFAVTTGATSAFDLYKPTITPNKLTKL